MVFKTREKEIRKNRPKSNWRRKNFKEAPRCSQYRKNLKTVIEKGQKEPLNTSDLLSVLKNVPHFLGVYAADELKSLSILNYPIVLVTNLDTKMEPGSHWLGIRITYTTIEIFDSLGFSPLLWGKYPKELFSFLSLFISNRNILISPILQQPNTVYCGLFVLYYILYRQNASFSTCIKQFKVFRLDMNLRILISLLKTI